MRNQLTSTNADSIDIFIHIGMPKSGSTSIQNTLKSLSGDLEKKGILFPTTPIKEDDNQAIVALCKRKERLPRDLKQRAESLSQEEINSMMDKWLLRLQKTVTQKYKSIIISSEYLFTMSDKEISTLKNKFEGIFHNPKFHIIAYVREPVAYWSSLMQQHIKANHRIKLGKSINYGVLSIYKSIFQSIDVFEFNKNKLPNGDVVRHFFGLIDPSIDLSGTSAPSNPSLSPEAIDIMQNFRKNRLPKQNGKRTPESKTFLRILGNSDKFVPGKKSSLVKPSVAALITEANTANLSMLASDFGINFGAPPTSTATQEDEFISADTIDQIYDVDQQRKNNLLMEVTCRLSRRLANQAREKQS
ncbi:hypothetical protein ACFPK9_06425 [Rubritalea spongiae]|uniref:Sulfotransferase family protein n=1 Tax=Rubritalea spongiae TaxID=430797 RepID=A0ABW5E4D6_9BACT